MPREIQLSKTLFAVEDSTIIGTFRELQVQYVNHCTAYSTQILTENIEYTLKNNWQLYHQKYSIVLLSDQCFITLLTLLIVNSTKKLLQKLSECLRSTTLIVQANEG